MRWTGLFRLWVVLSLLIVPTAAFFLARQDMATWETIDANNEKVCIDREMNSATHPDALACERAVGADKTVFQHENCTAAVYWSEALLGGFIVDLIITAIVAFVVAAVLWVRRGFAFAHTDL